MPEEAPVIRTFERVVMCLLSCLREFVRGTATRNPRPRLCAPLGIATSQADASKGKLVAIHFDEAGWW